MKKILVLSLTVLFMANITFAASDNRHYKNIEETTQVNNSVDPEVEIARLKKELIYIRSLKNLSEQSRITKETNIRKRIDYFEKQLVDNGPELERLNKQLEEAKNNTTLTGIQKANKIKSIENRIKQISNQ